MNQQFADILFENLKRIKENEGEHLHLNDFVLDSEGQFSLNEVIGFLEEHHFVETEQDEEIYFLTTKTYQALEEEYLYSLLLSKLGIKEDVYTNEELKVLRKEHRKSEKRFANTYRSISFIALILSAYFAYRSWEGSSNETEKPYREPVQFNTINDYNADSVYNVLQQKTEKQLPKN